MANKNETFLRLLRTAEHRTGHGTVEEELEGCAIVCERVAEQIAWLLEQEGRVTVPGERVAWAREAGALLLRATKAQRALAARAVGGNA